MNKLSKRLVSVTLYIILIISVILVAMFSMKNSSLTLADDATVKEQIAAYGSTLDMFIGWAYVLIGLAAAAAIIPSVIQLVLQPKNAIKTLVSLGVVAVLVFVAYSMADGTVFTSAQLPGYEGHDNVPGTLKFADTMIYTTYFLLAGAILSIVYVEVSKIFK